MDIAKIREEWGLQASFDYLMLRNMLQYCWMVVPHTYLPVLRMLSEDVGRVDAAYADVVAQREQIERFDSPRERWRKTYGSYVRELNWVSVELSRLLSKDQYEAFVTGAMARQVEAWAGRLKPGMARLFDSGRDGEAKPSAANENAPAPRRRKSGAVANWVQNTLVPKVMGQFNLGGFLVGPMNFEVLDVQAREMKVYIPNCAMHTVVSETEPQTEACLQSCKGACEAVFARGGPVEMEFEPHLPGLDCTMRVRWNPAARYDDGAFVPEARLLEGRRPAA